MKKVEHISDDKVIIDGVVFERAKPAKEQKCGRPHKGEICKITPGEGDGEMLRRFSHFENGMLYDDKGDFWGFSEWERLNDPLVIQLIPWEGGKSPADADQYVIVRLRNGELAAKKAHQFRWSHSSSVYSRDSDIVGYSETE